MKVVRDRGVRRHRAALRGAVSMSAAVCEVIAKEIGYPREQVTPESRLGDELRLDFFDLAELVQALESTFSARIPDSALHSFRSVADIERFLRAELHPAAARTSGKPRGSRPRVVSIGERHR